MHWRITHCTNARAKCICLALGMDKYLTCPCARRVYQIAFLSLKNMIRLHCCLLKLCCGTVHLSHCLVVAEELNMKAKDLAHCPFYSERVSAHIFHLIEQKFNILSTLGYSGYFVLHFFMLLLNTCVEERKNGNKCVFLARWFMWNGKAWFAVASWNSFCNFTVII